MEIVDCIQRTEKWERERCQPTASEFGSFITPVKGDYSASANAYAAKVVAKKRGIYTEPPPSYWMEWGTEHEDEARMAYTAHTGREVTAVGYVRPDHSDAYGGSPDGLVGEDGILEVKCPSPEKLVSYHLENELRADKGLEPKIPDEYKPQVQGLLMITERQWCDFFVYHPGVPPLLIRVLPDIEYQEKIAAGLIKLLATIERIETCLKGFPF